MIRKSVDDPDSHKWAWLSGGEIQTDSGVMWENMKRAVTVISQTDFHMRKDKEFTTI